MCHLHHWHVQHPCQQSHVTAPVILARSMPAVDNLKSSISHPVVEPTSDTAAGSTTAGNTAAGNTIASTELPATSTFQ